MRVEIRRHSVDKPWTYRALDEYQRRVLSDIQTGGTGCLLLSEVSPVITIGRRGTENLAAAGVWASPDDLKSRGIELLQTDRGGLATYHGPGQWVLFAVDRLDRLTGSTRGVRALTDRLLSAAAKVASESIDFVEIRQSPMVGIWSRRGKLGSVGLAIRDGVALHGLALNIYPTSTSFWGLNPCGLDAQVDYVDPAAADDTAKYWAWGERLVDTFLRAGVSGMAGTDLPRYAAVDSPGSARVYGMTPSIDIGS